MTTTNQISEDGLEFLNDVDNVVLDDLTIVDNPDYDTDGLDTTTDTARFTDEGGIIPNGAGKSFSQNNDSPDAGAEGHWGVDEGTE